MTSSKKKEDARIIAVDARKLAQGLKTTFEGVALVFDSIGADADVRILETSVASAVTSTEAVKPVKETKAVSKKKEKNNGDGDETEDAAGGSADVGDGDGDGDVQPDDVSDEIETAGAETTEDKNTDEDTESAAEEEPAEPSGVGTITQDDITKIIVQKIKQDRGNNEKIGQILKTYGVSKVGELDASKYEAFLTDISEL